jgi:hypothetical protein
MAKKHKGKKSKKAAVLGSAIATVVSVGIGVAYFVFMEFGDDIVAPSDQNIAASWTGQKPLRCGGSQVVTLENRTVENSGRVFPALLSAGGNCTLRIIKCKLKGDRVVSAGGNAKIIIEDSTLLGKRAIYAGGSAKVLISNSKIGGTRLALSAGGRSSIAYDNKTTIDGRKRGGRRILALQPGQDPEAIFAARAARSADVKRYRAAACAGIIGCYADNGHQGRFSARISLTVGADGKVLKTRYRLRRTSKKVKACLKQLNEGKTIADYKDGGGSFSCRASGKLMGGMRMVSSGSSYKASKAAAEQPAAMSGK